MLIQQEALYRMSEPSRYDLWHLRQWLAPPEPDKGFTMALAQQDSAI